jgi:trafficking protein particle complex subunit 6
LKSLQPEIRQIDAAALDYLAIELVSALRQSCKVASAKKKEREEHMIAAGVLPAPSLPPPLTTKKDSVRVAMLAARTAKASEEEEEALRLRLEMVGVQVGGNLAERYVAPSLTDLRCIFRLMDIVR